MPTWMASCIVFTCTEFLLHNVLLNLLSGSPNGLCTGAGWIV